MKCQRYKIDGQPCRSEVYDLDNTAITYFHKYKLCKTCFDYLNKERKYKKLYSNRLKNADLKCSECGSPLYNDNYSGFCLNCLRRLKREKKVIIRKYLGLSNTTTKK